MDNNQIITTLRKALPRIPLVAQLWGDEIVFHEPGVELSDKRLYIRVKKTRPGVLKCKIDLKDAPKQTDSVLAEFEHDVRRPAGILLFAKKVQEILINNGLSKPAA